MKEEENRRKNEECFILEGRLRVWKGRRGTGS